ncbi:2Fe-2S iron-sulfur cluster-binding protein [Streptomyces sp. NPDC058620]|uniref:2Fe-2S iron-sulfur cluster-binding protein n=1 Tax=Streptomyces sp. NPDC058620 TaxID=3346560 RepID=UPI0036667FDA
MSNEEPTEQQGQHDPYAQQYGGWQPTPQSGEYDAEATAFVHLPPEDLANAPLAAPGHGYVPPMILPLTPAAGLDPASTGSWVVQTPQAQDQQAHTQDQRDQHTHDPRDQRDQHTHDPRDQRDQHTHDPRDQHTHDPRDRHDPQAPDAPTGGEHLAPSSVHWPDPNQQHEHREDPVTSSTTAQWDFTEVTTAAAEPTAGSGAAGHTGQWTIPVADGDLPEESGEFATSTLASQWYTDTARPATLPGGAPAPWATQQPEEAGTALPAAGEAAEEAAELAEAPSAAEPLEAPAAELPDGTEAGEVTGSTDLGHAPAPDTSAPPADLVDSDSVPGQDPAAAAVPVTGAPSDHPSASYVLHVNGADRPVSDAWIGESLLYVLRERLGLAGAKDGCSQGECGACNVQVDGRLVASCLVPAATAAGSEVRTVEGLAVDGEPSDVQRALAACGAVQCGFCIPGMAMTIHDLLEGNHAPSELETRQALCGNLCRCSGYRGVLDAVGEVIAGREANADTSASAPADEARIPHQAPPGAGSVQPQPHEGGDL